MRRVSGSILLSVLAFSLLLLLFAFLVAGQSLMDLGFAGHFRQDSEAEQVARSAVTQFLSEAPRAPERPDYWFSRFQNPVFPDGGRHLSGQARITFDSTKPNYSADNSVQDAPGISYFDLGTPNKSVPPFGMSLVIQVDGCGQPAVYEAILQRRWPYVLTSPANVRLERSGGGPVTIRTQVDGNILRPARPAGVSPGVMSVPESIWSLMVRSGDSPASIDGVSVGADCSWNGHLRCVPGSSTPGVALETSPPGLIPPRPTGQWVGRLGSAAPPRNLDEMLTFPSRQRFSDITPTPLLPGELPPEPPPKNGYLTRCNVAPPGQDPEYQNVALNQLYLEGNDFYLQGDTTNTPPFPEPGDKYAGTGITLNNARLYIDGDLDLRTRANRQGMQYPGLKGNNSTLIINGNLVVEGGDVDAGDQGLVIMCRNLVLGASGSFRGLLLVQNSAFIYRPYGSPNPLQITGAVVCGRGKVRVFEEKNRRPPFDYDLLTLRGTELTYDAHYCKGILKYGEWQLMSLHKVR